ncbi:hypothetical protein JI739_09595 [Ramlibacter sp. AW1]|uniref:Uncharacterized protein n=1 Tax=Ramlibacter aurantiacus TaxID=2801330 RepID=A0A936ZNJ4_9BURK|nr:hypothetical protein [Ramlibacter aurantiacus]MBL0420595.1 hypothetical protein [Ramlibacter aurantiacus]
MSRLRAELQRLYAAQRPGADTEPLDLLGPHGRMRAMVLELGGRDGCDAITRVWQGVQAELRLPAPAVAVNGVDGLQLWFSLAEPVPWTQGAAFLDALRRRYLGELAPERVRLHPRGNGAGPAPTPPATLPPSEVAPGRWSAFLAPDLARLFADEPWLDLPPGRDAQAELLAPLRTIGAEELRQAMERMLQPSAEPAPASTEPAPTDPQPPRGAGGNSDPRTFLLAVMNDAAVALPLRIEAAKALLCAPAETGRS